MHFVVYLNLTLLCNLVYEIKFLIIFFKVSSNFVVYLLISSLFIKLFNIDSNNKFFKYVVELF